jgi:uncharacterized repeat protein (TIGR01451 family)
VFRCQPLRLRSYLFKNCVGGLVIATVVAAPSGIAPASEVINQAQYEYSTNQDPSLIQGKTATVTSKSDGLVDPIGTITGCQGQRLDSYAGYSVALYNTSDRFNPTALVRLDQTEFPDITGNNIPAGIAPNSTNINPYPLVANGDGKYNFLLNIAQTQVGNHYILIVKPPESSNYGERRILIEVTGLSNNILSYRATSLDGKPLSTTENATKEVSVNIANAAKIGLVGVGVCETQPVEIVKTADRATAEPGDTVVYRLTLRNKSDADIQNPLVRDTLPLGMLLRSNSVRAQLGDQTVLVTVSQTGQIASFQVGAPGFIIPARQVINLVYAVTLEADAIRGTGRNIATLTGTRSDNNQTVTDGPATHLLSIRQGLIRDTGTIIGRVFVDKNFDGQQQANEPGIPNAVIFTDDGNRITTDANGLFSVQSAVAGYRTGTLDLGSLPGYSLAPNLYFSEGNSRSRLVKLAPGGIVRLNFGVTPTAREVK